MGHEILYRDYPENVNKKSVEADWNHYAAMEGWQEGSSGLKNPIRWIERHVCESYEDAEAYIEKHDKGWYDQIAVRYKEAEPVKPSKTFLALKERADRLNARYKELDTAIHYKDVKSKLITCGHCESKISTQVLTGRLAAARGWINRNLCPVCGQDLRPASTLEKIQRAKENAQKAVKDVHAEMKKQQEKAAAKATKLRWLVKIEIHT